MEDLGQVNFENEILARSKMVYVPNWFSVDLKIGVSFSNRYCTNVANATTYVVRVRSASHWTLL